MPAPSTSRRGSRPEGVPWRDGFAVAGAALALYLVLLQNVFYGADGYALLQGAVHGATEHGRHVLYPACARAAVAAGAAAGIGPFRALELLSAVATAAGILALHRAAAVAGATRRPAALVAAGSAALPVTVFFATTIEVHGLFFLPASLAWWAAAHAAARPGPPAGAVLGLVVLIAGLTHASGHLLLPLLAAALLLRGSVRSLVPTVAVAAGTWTAGFVATRLLVPATASDALAFALAGAERLTHVALVPEYLLCEYLLPTFPFGLAALAAAAFRPDRIGAAHAAVVLAYAWATVAAVLGLREFGAYGVPLVFPAVWLTISRFGTRVGVACLALAAAGAVGLVRCWDARLPDPIDVEAVRRLAATGPTALLVEDRSESDPVLRELPQVAVVHIPVFLGSLPRTPEAAAADFFVAIDILRQGGRRVFVTGKGLAAFSRLAPEALARVSQGVRFPPEAVAGLDLRRVERRSTVKER
jgi:hypothetical protein